VRVIVVGAGLAGLTAARELVLAGADVVVVEAAQRVGGRVESITYPDGVVAEAHMEEFWEGSPAYALLRELGLALKNDAAHSAVIIDGCLHPYQGDGVRDDYLAGLFDPVEREALLEWNAFALTVCGQLQALGTAGDPLPAYVDQLRLLSFRDHIDSFGLPWRVREWIRVLLEPETSVGWGLIPALDGIEEMRIFLDTPAGFGETNFHVVEGNSRFVETLAQALPPGALRMTTRATRVIDEGGRCVVRVVGPDGRESDLVGDAVIVTVPLFDLDRIVFDPPLAGARAEAVRTAAFGHYVKVLVRARPEAAQAWSAHGAGLFTLLSDGPIGSVYDHSPDDGRDLLLSVLLHADSARAVREMDVSQTAAHSMRELDAFTVCDRDGRCPTNLFGDLSRHVTDVRVFQYPSAVAYWPVDRRRSRFDAVADALRAPHGRVQIGGDTTDGSHSEGAVVAGQRMARRLIAHGPLGSPSPTRRHAPRVAHG